MNNRLLLLVSSPALLLGVVLVGACTIGVWAINVLQNRLAHNFHQKVESVRAAHEMEVAIRQLRFDSLMNLLHPSTEWRRATAEDHQEFEAALKRTRRLAAPEQASLVQQISDAYRRYRDELAALEKLARAKGTRDVSEWIEAHPIQHVVGPCEALLDANQNAMETALNETEVSSRRLQLLLLGLGALGPIGGLVCGYSIARALSRSIARLQVCVQDVHSQLAPEVGVVDLRLGRGLDGLHDQMQAIVERVQALVERLQTQQREITRSEQLAVVGHLASSLAHEIRNPLTAMKWLIDGALQSYPREELRLDDLKVLQGEIARMGRTVQSMLDFVRPARPQRCVVDLRETVHQALELVRARKRQLGVTCALDLPSTPALAQVDPSQMKSVLVNLLLNALDAMPRGGAMTVRLSRPTPGELELVVADTGAGIAPEVLERLFHPFMTTKATGTGLGLSVSKRFVEEHGGRLTADNQPGGGACFRVLLPAVQEAPQECPSPVS